MGKKKNASWVLVGKSEEMRSLGRYRREDNIKLGLTEIG
jgi:hypothetical protein